MITAVFAVLTGLSAVYGIVVFLYSGFNTVWLWAGLTGLFGFLSWASHYYLLHKKTVPLWMPVSVSTFLAACLVIFVTIEGLIFLNAAGNPVQNLDYVIVLGARVKKDGISRSLKERLDTAIQYSEENPETIFVLSGGKGIDEPISEAEAMRDYMVYNGVAPDKILLETHSTSTVENIAYSRLVIEEDRAKLSEAEAMRDYMVYNGVAPDKILLETHSTSTVENIAYSRLVIEEDRAKRKDRQEKKADKVQITKENVVMAPDKPTQIGILTNDFHIFRAKAIAKEWGIRDAAGIAAPSDPILFIHQCVREALAIFKDRVMGNM